MPPPPKYTLAEKAAFIVEARAMQRTGVPKRLIAAHLGVSLASLSTWLRDDTLAKLYPPQPLLLPRNRISGQSIQRALTKTPQTSEPSLQTQWPVASD
jgi:hypothetical protein